MNVSPVTNEEVAVRQSIRFAMVLLGSLLGGIIASPTFAGKENNSVIWASVGVPRHLNPAVQSGVYTMQPGAQIFASPLRVDGDWKIQPYLAESWEFSSDQKTLTLKLRKGAKFHDGVPITSADVAFSLMTVKKYHPFRLLSQVEKIDTPDDNTVIVHLSQPSPALLLSMTPPFCPILPKHIFDDGQPLPTHPRNVNPVGSGPFKLVDFNPEQHIILEKFPDFFLPGRPKLDRVVIKIFKDANALALAMEAKEADFAALITDISSIDRLAKLPNLVVSDEGGRGVGPLIWIAFNTAKKPFDDVKVRQAISFVLDREFITKRLQRGRTQIATGPIAPSSPYYTSDVELYKVDLAKAERLLDEAGLKKNAQGIRFKTSILFTAAGRDYSQNVAEYMKAQLKRIGVDLELVPVPDFPSWAKRVGGHDFDMTTDNVFNWGDPTIGVDRTYLTSNIRKGVVWSNTQSYSNPRVDELLAKAAVETNEDKRKQLYKEFQQIVVRDAPVAFINVVPHYSAYDKRLKGLPMSIWGSHAPIDELSWE